MAEETGSLVRREVRSPRSAAIAGIVYSLLMLTIMTVTSSVVRVRPEDVTREWLETWFSTASLVLALVPFVGIAFLWFTGVIRDRLGHREDRFFATIFFGSGIIQVLLLFLWGAVFGAILGTRAVTGVSVAGNYMYVFAFVLMNEIIGNYGLRMAGVYMTAIATLWTRTAAMPRWLIIVTYILALGFLVGAPRIREARFIFPVWVLVVSVYVLVMNYRRTHDQEGDDRLSVDD
jgi:MFS family permease